MSLEQAAVTLAQHNELVRELGKPGGPVEQDLKLLLPVGKIWQPSDMLPDLTRDDWIEQVNALRKGSSGLSDGVLVVLVGNTVTEEALPAYMTWLNRVDAIRDETGADLTPWAQWIRGWTAEEKRHDTALDHYLYLSGRVNMKAVDETVHNLIKNGFDSGVGKDPYKAFTYVAFQETATELAHKHESRMAQKEGDEILFKLCGAVGGDEGRHKIFYKNRVRDIFQADPEGAIIAFSEMMKEEVVMPAAKMDDGESPITDQKSPLFQRFADVAHSIDVYTAADYFQIARELIKFWGVLDLSVSGKAARAQDELGKYTQARSAERINKIMDRSMKHKPDPTFSWIYGRAVPLKRAA